MAKIQLKKKIARLQNDRCALTGVTLSERQSLNDTDRRIPKALNGTYLLENTRLVEPRAHMVRHGTLRLREESLEKLKSLFDDRVQTMKLKFKINNQLLAYQRRVDHLNPEVVSFLEESAKPIDARMSVIDKQLAAVLKTYPDPFVQRVLKVTSVGPVTVAALTVYIDLTKASTPSSLWKYVGLHTSSNNRYTKGEAGGGNKTLRTVLWNTANCMMKNRLSGYRPVYDRTKMRLAASEKVVQSRNTQGNLVEVQWKNTKPSHRHGAALRSVIKMFLCDYWLIGREMNGMPITTPYVEGILGHTDIIPPSARGW